MSALGQDSGGDRLLMPVLAQDLGGDWLFMPAMTQDSGVDWCSCLPWRKNQEGSAVHVCPGIGLRRDQLFMSVLAGEQAASLSWLLG